MNIISAYPWVCGSVCRDWGHMLCASLILSIILCWNFSPKMSQGSEGPFCSWPLSAGIRIHVFLFLLLPHMGGSRASLPRRPASSVSLCFLRISFLAFTPASLYLVSLPSSCRLLILDLFNLVFLALGYFLSFCVSLAI